VYLAKRLPQFTEEVVRVGKEGGGGREGGGRRKSKERGEERAKESHSWQPGEKGVEWHWKGRKEEEMKLQRVGKEGSLLLGQDRV
jgi:hypothetical protein